MLNSCNNLFHRLSCMLLVTDTPMLQLFLFLLAYSYRIRSMLGLCLGYKVEPH